MEQSPAEIGKCARPDKASELRTEAEDDAGYEGRVASRPHSHAQARHAPGQTLPETGFLRLNQIIGDKKADPPAPPIIPVGKSTWWEGVRTGRFPAPVKLGPRTTAWRAEDIRSLIAELAGCEP